MPRVVKQFKKFSFPLKLHSHFYITYHTYYPIIIILQHIYRRYSPLCFSQSLMVFFQCKNNNNYKIVRSMSDESSLYSQSDREHNERLSSIWRNIKQTKNISKSIIKPHDPHKYYYHDTKPVKNSPSIYSSYHVHPPQQQRQAQNITHLMNKLQQAEQQNFHLKSSLQNIEHQAHEKIEVLRKDYEKRLRGSLRRQKQQQKQNLYDNKHEGKKADHLTKQIQRMTLKIKSLQLQNRNSQAQILKLNDINQQLNAALSQEQKDITSTILINNGKGSQLLQLTEANNTIQRLIELLKKTDEYRQFSMMISESKEMHYLKNILKRLKNNQLNVSKNIKKTCSCHHNILPENILWSPVQCYKLMLSMKLKYDYLSEDCIEQVLFEVNRIYNNKEGKQMARMKAFYENEIVKLKKRMEEGYDELMSKKQISRLKKEIKVFKSGQKVKPQAKMQGLRNKGQYQDELKLKTRQIKLLQERIRLFQTQNGYHDKSLYYEGALWIMDKILGELQSNQCTLKQFEIGFRARIDQNFQADDWLRSYKQFFQRMSQLNSQMVDRLLTTKESMIVKMGHENN